MTLTEAEVTAITKILEKKGIRDRHILKGFLWANITDAKYQKGDCFEVTDHRRSIYGVPVVKFHAKIVDIRWLWLDKQIEYQLNGYVLCCDQKYEFTIWQYEDELKVRVKDNQNVIKANKFKAADEMFL